MTEVFERAAEVFRQGGPIMWPLLVLSVVSIALSFERTVFWARTHARGKDRWVRSVVQALRAGDRSAARALSGRDSSVYGRVLDLILAEGDARIPSSTLIEIARHDADRFNASLSTIITAAPLLGILGTVLGIIESFDLLGGSEAVADISAVAAGIAEALTTTAFGLVVALVSLFPYMAFRSHADRCLGRIEAIGEATATTGARNSDGE